VLILFCAFRQARCVHFLRAPLKPHVRFSIASSCDLCFAMMKYASPQSSGWARKANQSDQSLYYTYTLPPLSQRSLISPGSSHAWFLRLSLVNTRPMLQFAIYLICYNPLEQEEENEVVDYITVFIVETSCYKTYCRKNITLSKPPLLHQCMFFPIWYARLFAKSYCRFWLGA
jgi:hypothetical protein